MKAHSASDADGDLNFCSRVNLVISLLTLSQVKMQLKKYVGVNNEALGLTDTDIYFSF